MMKYIDAHAHMNFKAYDEDRDEVIRRALDAGVGMINVGTQADTSREAIELAEKYDEGVYAIIGLHPVHANASYHDTEELGEEGKAFTSRGEDFDINVYRDMVMHPKVVGIGECGLDYFRTNSAPEFVSRQKQAFAGQIELAIESNKPIMIHCRDAYQDTIDMLQSYKKEVGDRLRGNVHFFAGTTDIAQQFLDLGFTLSFTGVITFAEKDYRELVEYVPIDRMLSETDCPYVTPKPYRGQRNEPLYVIEVVKKIAEIKGLDHDTAATQILNNIRTQYGI